MAGYIGLSNEKTMTNLVSNSSLSSNITGWTKGSTTYFTFTQNTGYYNATTKAARTSTTYRPCLYQDFATSISSDTSKKIYLRAELRGLTTNNQRPSLMFRQKIGTSTSVTYNDNVKIQNTGTWETVSIYLDTNDGTTAREIVGVGVGIVEPWAAGDSVDIRNIFAVNLTEEFGVGNEPTKSWCDNNIIFQNETIKYESHHINISKIYFGLNGIAKQIKRAYVGINGIAHRWFGYPDKYSIMYNGLASNNLSASKYNMAAGTVGDTAIFAGGATNMLNITTGTLKFSKAVDTYNSSLIHSTLPDLTYQMAGAGVATLGNQLMIMGGLNSASGSGSSHQEVTMAYGWYYNAGLISTGHFAGANLSTARCNLAAGTIGNNALFAGGSTDVSDSNMGSSSSVVDAYSSATSVAVTTPASLRADAWNIASCSSNDYILFAGGMRRGTAPYCYALTPSETSTASVTAYNTSLVQSSVSNLYTANTSDTAYPSAARAGNYLLVLTQNSNSDSSSNNAILNAYNGSSLTKTAYISSIQNKINMMSATVNGCALFFGGTQESGSFTKIQSDVDMYTSDLVHCTLTSLSIPKLNSGIAVVGDYVLIAGGKTNGLIATQFSSTVDVYKLSLTPNAYITSAGSTNTDQQYACAYITVNNTVYTSVGSITMNEGDTLTIYGKAAYGSYSSGDTTYYYDQYLQVRIDGTVLYTCSPTGNYTTSFYSKSMTVPHNMAYTISLVNNRSTATNASRYQYVDIYTQPGFEKESQVTPVPPTNLIAFTVQVYNSRSDTSTYWNYMAESGMTWNQFINSTYNVGDFYIISSSYAGYYAPSSWGPAGVYLKTAAGGSNISVNTAITANYTYYCLSNY